MTTKQIKTLAKTNNIACAIDNRYAVLTNAAGVQYVVDTKYETPETIAVILARLV